MEDEKEKETKKENEEKTKVSKWRTQDWVWLVGILSAIIVCILTFRLSDNQEVTDMFSFIANSVSIVLAIVAIGIALKQDSENKIVNFKVNEILSGISNKVDNVNDNILRMKEKDLEELANEQIESIPKEQTKETYTKEELNDIVKEMMVKYGDNLINKINIENNSKNIYRNNARIKNIQKLKKLNPQMSLDEVAKELNMSRATLNRILMELDGTYLD